MNTYSPSWDWPLTCLLTNYQTFPTGWWLLHPSMTRNHNPEPIELKIFKETQKPSHIARWIGIVAVALIAFLLTTSSALAQATGQVSGVVTDPTGAVVPAATVTLRNLDTNAIRTINMDNHKKAPIDSWMGWSNGHWEGETLVVDTIGFNDKSWIDMPGHPHTAQMHLTERFSRPNLGTLNIDITIDDPGAYTKPWIQKRSTTLETSIEMTEYVCNENNQDPVHLDGAHK